MISPFWELMKRGKLRLLLRFSATVNKFYEVVYIATLFKEELAQFLEIPRSIEEVSQFLGVSEKDAIKSWLQLGVSLGLLKKQRHRYYISNVVRRLLEDDKDDFRAILEEVATLHHKLISQTLSVLKEGKLWTLDDQEGKLIARSSRIVEPFIKNVIRKLFPTEGKVRLLEVGCGSGIYIKHAVEHNPQLEAVGVELQPEVARLASDNLRRWGIAKNAQIIVGDIREMELKNTFDIITLFNNIYYFPVDEREGLLRKLVSLLNKEGKLVITTVCQGGQPISQMLDLWASSTQGCGRLPYRSELVRLLKKVALTQVQVRKLIPRNSFYVFWGRKRS